MGVWGHREIQMAELCAGQLTDLSVLRNFYDIQMAASFHNPKAEKLIRQQKRSFRPKWFQLPTRVMASEISTGFRYLPMENKYQEIASKCRGRKELILKDLDPCIGQNLF